MNFPNPECSSLVPFLRSFLHLDGNLASGRGVCPTRKDSIAHRPDEFTKMFGVHSPITNDCAA
jgi:hypothetical protein